MYKIEHLDFRKDLKKRAQEMSRSDKVSRTFDFLLVFWSCWENPSKSLRATEKSQGASEKNKEHQYDMYLSKSPKVIESSFQSKN